MIEVLNVEILDLKYYIIEVPSFEVVLDIWGTIYLKTNAAIGLIQKLTF